MQEHVNFLITVVPERCRFRRHSELLGTYIAAARGTNTVVIHDDGGTADLDLDIQFNYEVSPFPVWPSMPLIFDTCPTTLPSAQIPAFCGEGTI